MRCWWTCSSRPIPPRRQAIVLDLDATDDPLHGKQEGRFFHGYYGHHCYLPLYINRWKCSHRWVNGVPKN